MIVDFFLMVSLNFEGINRTYPSTDYANVLDFYNGGTSSQGTAARITHRLRIERTGDLPVANQIVFDDVIYSSPIRACPAHPNPRRGR